jgi:hypothetical protein
MRESLPFFPTAFFPNAVISASLYPTCLFFRFPFFPTAVSSGFPFPVAFFPLPFFPTFMPYMVADKQIGAYATG